MKTAIPNLAHLSPQERLALIAQLWDSLTDDDLPLSPAQEAELDRRLASFDADRNDGVSWQQLQAELRQRRE
jgi:putative addiction module component (TIGR02574 family)